MRVDFYHLTRAPAEDVLPLLAEKTLAAGGRMLIVSENVAQLGKIDETLWTFKADSFVPHAKAGGDGDADQPVLLSTATKPTNGATFLALADGKWREEALGFERALFLFTPERIDDARGIWRLLGDAEAVERHYWKQDESGRWKEGP